MSNVHILTGCGGTGISTLLRTLELMVEDQYWRSRLHTDVYFILIDTDSKDIENFQLRKKALLAGLRDEPYVMVHNLAQNIMHLQTPVLNHFRSFKTDPAETAGRDRLLAHWWNRGPEMPFYAPWVSDIIAGAGQCSPVSYFLSWLRMRDFEQSLDQLLREIENRGRSWSMLNTVIVSGLAGGTGRGCWQWIGFKMRDFFARNGHQPSPTGFLIDQSAFNDRKIKRPRTATSMTINSLTGLSELSAWIANQRVPGYADSYGFRLPSFASPDNERSDVIQPDPMANQNHGGPINSAYLIFGSNGKNHLASAEQYFEMVGTGIYCALSNSDVKSQKINDRSHYNSMASATVEIKANQIRKFFEWTSRARAIARLQKVDPAAATKAHKEFLRTTKLRLGLSSGSSVTASGTVANPMVEDERGTPLQRFLAILSDQRNGKRIALSEAFRSDDHAIVLDAAQQLAAESETMVAEAREKLIDQYNMTVTDSFPSLEESMKRGPVGQALAAAHELYQSMGSVRNVLSMIRHLRLTLAGERESLNKDFEGEFRDVARLVTELSGRQYGLIGERFNDDEEKEIFDTCEMQFVGANSEHIRSYLQAIYGGLIKQLSDVETRLESYREALQAAEVTLEDRCNAIVPGTSDAFSILFCDPTRPEESAIDPLQPERFHRRTLRPIMTEELVDQLVEPIVSKSVVLTSLIEDALRPLDDDPYVQQQNVRHQRDRIIEEVTQTVRIPDDFMPREFSLRKVASDLAKVWCRRLDEAVSMDDRSYLLGRCRSTLGFTPETLKGQGGVQHQLPSTEEIIHSLAAVTAQNCKAYWQVRNDDMVKDFTVTLFFVTDLSAEESKTLVRQRLGDRPIELEVVPKTDNNQYAGHNPYVLLAYSSEGLDDLESLQSVRYHEEAGIEGIIKKTEDPSGEIMFHQGIGFTSPVFVNDKELSAKRWKPWASDLAFAESEHERQVLDATLYALFPGVGADAEEASVSDLHRRLAGIDWPTPLFRLESGNRFKFSRLPREWEGGKGREDHQTVELDGWSPNGTVASSAGIANVLQKLKSSDALVQRLLQEAETFLRDVLPSQQYGPKTQERQEVFHAYQRWLREQMDAFEKDDPARQAWSALLTRAAHWGIQTESK